MTDVRTVNAALEQLAEWRPNHTAFVQAETGRRETFSEINEITRSLANALSDNGVGKGDVVALLSRTTVEHALSYFAVQKVGAIPATLHNREAPNKIVFLVDQVGAKGLFFQPQFADTAEAIMEDYRERVPLERGAEPEEIADGMVFLASDEASYVSGHDLVIDGEVTASTGQPNFAKHLGMDD